MSGKPKVFHIPVCPFSQRLEILLELKRARSSVTFEVVDITRPRDPALLARTRGSTALPVLETADGRILRESLVLLQYLDDSVGECRVAQQDPYRRAVELLMTSFEGPFVAAGYRYVLNQELAERDAHRNKMLAQYASLNDFLIDYATGETFLFEEFGWAEAVYTPMFMRFWFLEYYEGFELPGDSRFDRVRRWRDACLRHPAAQQVTREQIVKLYYDYARGAGNGALVPGRKLSSFVFEPHWSKRPMPPADKYAASASDEALGLAAG